MVKLLKCMQVHTNSFGKSIASNNSKQSSSSKSWELESLKIIQFCYFFISFFQNPRWNPLGRILSGPKNFDRIPSRSCRISTSESDGNPNKTPPNPIAFHRILSDSDDIRIGVRPSDRMSWGDLLRELNIFQRRSDVMKYVFKRWIDYELYYRKCFGSLEIPDIV